jgi:hypothetical protein
MFWLIIKIIAAIIYIPSFILFVVWTIKAFRGTLEEDVPDDLKDLF